MDELPQGWNLIEKLGEGGMCAVYRAEKNGEERALKVLLGGTQSTRDRFLAEAEILAQLDHPNVIDVDALLDGDPPWLVMELLGGRDLAHHRDDGSLTSPEQAARWMADIASGLQAVHDAGLVHRDLKPNNMMLGDDGVPRLIDFGIARQTGDAHRTAQGVLMGTASYLAPEMFTNRDPKALQDQTPAEVYALGQTLCELLIGRAIHEDEGAESSMMARLMADKMSRRCLDPREWRTVPQGLCAIVMRATEADPTERIQTAAEFERLLREWLTERDQTEAAPVSILQTLSAFPALPSAPVVARVIQQRSSQLWMNLGAAGGVVVLHGALWGVTVLVIAALWVLQPNANEHLANQIRDDARVTNCIAGSAHFTVRADGNALAIEGLPSDDDAACLQVLGWTAAPGATVQVQVR